MVCEIVEYVLLLFIFNIWAITMITYVAYSYDLRKTRQETWDETRRKAKAKRKQPCSLCSVCATGGCPYNPETYCKECEYNKIGDYLK